MPTNRVKDRSKRHRYIQKYLIWFTANVRIIYIMNTHIFDLPQLESTYLPFLPLFLYPEL